jgi:hypothetical protein
MSNSGFEGSDGIQAMMSSVNYLVLVSFWFCFCIHTKHAVSLYAC